MTGAVASQTVTEARNGTLRWDGNPLSECNGTRGPDCKAYRPRRDESRP